MDKDKLIELTFVQWVASLKERPRGKDHVKPNFDDLFIAFKNAGATFDDIYETYLPKAIKAHQPTPSLARSFYKLLKSKLPNFSKSEKEFIEEWNDSINATGTESFFEVFPVTSLDQDDEPKVFGNMSVKEYRAQRKYADQFPTLDTTELVKEWKKEKYNINIDDMIENVLGDKND
jgi:hypothetical protein